MHVCVAYSFVIKCLCIVRAPQYSEFCSVTTQDTNHFVWKYNNNKNNCENREELSDFKKN